MLHGHDFATSSIFDSLGIFYVCAAVAYTGLVALGLICLWWNRNAIAIRIRRFPMIAAAVLTIHVYATLVLLAYPLNGSWTCGAEFWVMSTILPTGIALFQASNIQLLSLYEEQHNLATATSLAQRKERPVFTPRGLYEYWKQQSTVRKTTIGIAIGLVVQIILTFFLYFGSRRFHSSRGIFGSRATALGCRRGPEWVPSVLWQFLWGAVFGPYVLYRIRFIRDTHNWALQTKIAIIAAIPGTPMWLAFLYLDSSNVARVNRYFCAAGWFLPGLMAMQLVSIVVPLYDLRKSKQLSERASSIYSNFSKTRDMYSMAALEVHIQKNIEPLLQWASQKDFTAENIVFLKSVRDFKKKWEMLAKRSDLSPLQVRERFEEAALIYFTLVHPNTAKFNVNVESSIYVELEETFAGISYEPYVQTVASEPTNASATNVITPWADMMKPSNAFTREKSVEDLERLYPAPVTEIELTEGGYSIPRRFNADVFDKAYDSVKYLVFTNTWVKFIDAGETTSIAESDLSNDAIVGRFVK